MSDNLQLFWKLASSSEEERLTSSDKLVADLLQQQSALPSTSKATLESIESSDQEQQVASTEEDVEEKPSDPMFVSTQEAEQAEETIGNRNAADLTYALRRLIRGLASPRENSRLGFAVALTELLSNLETVTSQEILALLLKYSAPQGSMTGQEQRDLMFAKLFGVLALIQSQILFRETSSLSHFKKALEIIFALFATKAWMGESCGWVVVQTVDQLNRDGRPAWRDEALHWIAQRTCSSKELTPEKFAVIFKLAQTGAVKDLEELIVPPFTNAQLLSSANLPILARILKDSSPSDSQEGPSGSRGSFKPQLHFVWDVILDAYFAHDADTSYFKAAPFPEFFKVIVDESLFSASSSTERKSWGFQVFGRVISRASDAEKPLLFTPNFMRTWINQLSKDDRYLHNAALKAAEAVQEAVKNNPKLGFTLVSQLIGEHGSQNFDRITKTKTVEGVLSSLDVQGVKDYVKHLRDLICSGEAAEESDELSSNVAQRRWAFDQLLSLVRNTAIPMDDACITDILEFFIAHGYYSMKQPVKKSGLLDVVPQPDFSEEAKQQCRSRVLSCLAELSGQTTILSDSDGKTRKAQGVTSSGDLWLAKAHDILLRFDKDHKTFQSVFDRDEEIAAKLKAGVACFTKVHKQESCTKDASVKEQLRAFQNLLLAGLIVSVDAEDGASDLVEPLCDCADRLWPVAKGNGKKASKATEEGEEEADGIDVLIDCIVNFLELPSVFLRTVAGHTFEAFSKDMTASSLDHLLVQLGQETAQDMDVDEGAEQDKENDEDVKADGDAESDTSATSDDDEEEEEEDIDDSEVDPELRAKIQAALRDSGIAEAGEDMDDDDDSSSEFSEMDDDQMIQLDKKLADIFRQQTSTRNSKKETKREENVFKNKLLDLIEIFARKESGNSLVLRLISPLFTLAKDEDAEDSQLPKRAANVLRTRLCKGKESPQGIAFSELAEDLEQVHKVARSSTKAELANLANAVNIYLTKVALSSHSTPSATEDADLIKIYKETLSDFLTRKKSHVKPAFLVDAFRRFPLLGWILREDLLESCRPRAAAHAFRQLQAMQMLQAIMTQLAQLPEKVEIMGFIPEINKCVCEIVSSAAQDADSPFNANRLKESIKFVLQVARLSKKLASSDDKLKAAWKSSKLHEAADTLQTSERLKASTSIHALFKQLFGILEPSAASDKASKNNKEDSPSKAAGKKRPAAAQEDGVDGASPAKSGTPKQARTK